MSAAMNINHDSSSSNSSRSQSLNENEATTPDVELDVHNEAYSMSSSQAWSLYTSHFLSTWNMRMYEFAAIIFTAAAFPETLLAASIRGIVRTLAAICFSSYIGRWIDRSPDRLKTLTTTIVVNRLSVMCACTLWFFIVYHDGSLRNGVLVASTSKSSGTGSREILFTAILSLGILETLSAAGNTLSMERDWVVVAASPPGKPYDLTQLNSVMRRIDLTCKLIAPIFISIIVSVTRIEIGVFVVGSLSTICFPVEWLCAKRVWMKNSKLRAPKDDATDQDGSISEMSRPVVAGFMNQLGSGLKLFIKDFKDYFSSIVWIPSLALAILHLSALAYSATFITFLLNVGFSLDVITFARTAGSIVEISSTVVTPIGVTYLSKAKNRGRYIHQAFHDGAATGLLEVEAEDRGTEIGIFRLGLWGITWQVINLVPVLYSLWALSTYNAGESHKTLPVMSSITLFFFLSTSRLGLWIYDLTTQQLTQTMTIPSQRSSFAGVENSFVNFFELLQNVVVIFLPLPGDFKFIAVLSFVAVAVSTIMYAGWVFRMRGHLVHWDAVIKSCECVKIRLGHA